MKLFRTSATARPRGIGLADQSHNHAIWANFFHLWMPTGLSFHTCIHKRTGVQWLRWLIAMEQVARHLLGGKPRLARPWHSDPTKNLIYQVGFYLFRPTGSHSVKPFGCKSAARELLPRLLNLSAYTMNCWQPKAPKIVEHVAMVSGWCEDAYDVKLVALHTMWIEMLD